MLKAKIEIIYHACPRGHSAELSRSPQRRACPERSRRDNDILVINKPAGLSVTKDRTGALQLLDILAKQLEPRVASELRLVHRLDKDTSGVMILAKNKQTQSRFSSYFEKGLIKKTYLALVTGAIPAQQGTINALLVRNRKNTALMCIAAKKGKEAVTDWQLLADFGTAKLLVVHPLTSRTHQIRLHLSSIGLPLAIDPLYGSSQPLFLSDFKSDYRLAKGQTEKPLIDRLTLHAYQLSIANCKSKIANEFIAPLDKKFTATIKMLNKHNPNGLDAFLDPDIFPRIINAQRL